MFTKFYLTQCVLLILALALAACVASPTPSQEGPSADAVSTEVARLVAQTVAAQRPTQAPDQPAATPSTTSTQAPEQPTPVSTSTQVTAAPTMPSASALPDVTLDYSAVAQDVTVETVAAQPADAGGPYWDAAPQYRRLTLQGYPVATHLLKPQILIYPVADMPSANEASAKIAGDLQALLKTRQAGDHLPFLPLFNASQVMYAQLQFMDFKSGAGVRYLTQFDQALLPINNYELIYTFQGLTGDGKYYIAAVLPVTNPELPADPKVSEQQAKELSDFPAYLSKTVSILNQQPSANFTPALDVLDALVRSIEVK
jgi:hypothetical protein